MKPRRFRRLVVILAVALAAVMARAVQVMIIDHREWLTTATRQQQRRLTVPSKRGDIVSADGYVLATSVDRVAIQVQTARLSHAPLFRLAAAEILGLAPKEVDDRLTRRWSWLAKGVSPETGLRVRKMAPAAVALVPDSARIYPHGQLGATLVGFIGREALRIVGRSGLEYRFNTTLTGQPGRVLAVYDATRRELRVERLAGGRAGLDLQLTLNARLQAACERELRHALDRTDAAAATAVVLEPTTGDVLALGSLPAFERSRPAARGAAAWRIRPVQDAWEPGSTVKPFAAAAALAEGVVRPGERFPCRDRGVRVAGHWIRDFAPPGTYDLEGIITYSSNQGMVTVAQRLSPSVLEAAYRAFGFGVPTRLGLPGESHGLLPGPETWSALSAAELALGEELTVTPLQLAVAYGAIANGGWLLRPRLVRSDPHFPPVRRVMDSQLAQRLTAMLEQVVATGTGTAARLPGFRVAGKTGTAQRAVDGSLETGRHVAWFAGFFPATSPKAVVVVALLDPQGDFWAASTAAPVFSAIAHQVALELSLVPAVDTAGATRGRT